MKKFILLSTALICLGLASCNKSTTSGSSHLSVKLTDAPGAYDAVILSIKSVVVVTASGEQTLNVGGGPINILNFRSGKDTLLASLDLPAGVIQQIRFVLNETGNRVVINDTSYNLTTPSAQTSGLKLEVNDSLKSGSDFAMRLDFDAAKSIVMTGNGTYILKPVIREIRESETGSITGTVTPIGSYPKVYAINGTDTLGSLTDSTGKFNFTGVDQGSYSIYFAPMSPYFPKTLSGVMVTNGAIQNVGVITISK